MLVSSLQEYTTAQVGSNRRPAGSNGIAYICKPENTTSSMLQNSECSRVPTSLLPRTLNSSHLLYCWVVCIYGHVYHKLSIALQLRWPVHHRQRGTAPQLLHAHALVGNSTCRRAEQTKTSAMSTDGHTSDASRKMRSTLHHTSTRCTAEQQFLLRSGGRLPYLPAVPHNLAALAWCWPRCSRMCCCCQQTAVAGQRLQHSQVVRQGIRYKKPSDDHVGLVYGTCLRTGPALLRSPP
jgi:hypothetical protein